MTPDPTPVPGTVDPLPLVAALAYAGRGWRVIPIIAGTKRPAYDAWQRVATTDPAKIREWWTDRPTLGVGIVTGRASGIWALDVDVSHGKQGDETLADLEAEHGGLPATPEQINGSGGRHIIFRYPEGVAITNGMAARLGPGLDVRGEGGQIVAAPTMHPETGRRTPGRSLPPPGHAGGRRPGVAAGHPHRRAAASAGPPAADRRRGPARGPLGGGDLVDRPAHRRRGQTWAGAPTGTAGWTTRYGRGPGSTTPPRRWAMAGATCSRCSPRRGRTSTPGRPTPARLPGRHQVRRGPLGGRGLAAGRGLRRRRLLRRHRGRPLLRHANGKVIDHETGEIVHDPWPPWYGSPARR